jgi:hypothetical protein
VHHCQPLLYSCLLKRIFRTMILFIKNTLDRSIWYLSIGSLSCLVLNGLLHVFHHCATIWNRWTVDRPFLWPILVRMMKSASTAHQTSTRDGVSNDRGHCIVLRLVLLLDSTQFMSLEETQHRSIDVLQIRRVQMAISWWIADKLLHVSITVIANAVDHQTIASLFVALKDDHLNVSQLLHDRVNRSDMCKQVFSYCRCTRSSLFELVRRINK